METVEFRQNYVKHDCIERDNLRHPESMFAIGRDLNRMALRFQTLTQTDREAGFVFAEKDFCLSIVPERS